MLEPEQGTCRVSPDANPKACSGLSEQCEGIFVFNYSAHWVRIVDEDDRLDTIAIGIKVEYIGAVEGNVRTVLERPAHDPASAHLTEPSSMRRWRPRQPRLTTNAAAACGQSLRKDVLPARKSRGENACP
jgi:hypothetical protein